MTSRVLIVGATSAIAQAAARCFAVEQARLFLCARDPKKLQAVADDLSVRGAQSVRAIAGDLEDDNLRAAILTQAAEEWQGLDFALIAYGALPDQDLCERHPAALRAAIQTNWTSVAAWMSELSTLFEGQATTNVEAPRGAQGGGTLAVIGSVAGDRGRRSNYVYGSAKAAVETFAAGLRLRFAGTGVKIVLIKPGWVSTPMTALLPQNPLYSDAGSVGLGVYRAMLRGREVVYLPWFWRGIMLLVRAIPEPLFARLKL